MSYLSLLIALFITWGEETISEGAWLYIYLNNLVDVEKFFYSASWWLFGFFILIALIIGAISLLKRSEEGISMSLGCGCFTIFWLLQPLLAWITMKLSMGMASAVGPQGIIDSGKFWVNMIIFILIGIG
jgi:hypothetical protein